MTVERSLTMRPRLSRWRGIAKDAVSHHDYDDDDHDYDDDDHDHDGDDDGDAGNAAQHP